MARRPIPRDQDTAPAGSDDARTSTPAQPDGKRMKGEQRKAQIIDAAIALFGRHGFKGTTTKALAEAAGVSEATIFKHFPTKEALYAAAFERRTGVGTAHLVDTLQGYADRQDDEGLLRALVQAILIGYEQDRDLHRMLMYVWLEQGPTENRRMWAQMRHSPLFDFIERYVRQRQAEGAFCSNAPEVVAAAVLALPVHYAIRTKLYGIDPEHADEEIVETFARLLLDGARGGTSVER
ncbi:MAG: TetR/AcrR family transcriptional regulator [Vicinamibacterales bacterium]|nr:TetR/AcrR family transcriptional regulator [Vicinamibacterales bacterium]HJN44728.1 TetR/AcrR family transcriptional regulator [Vicinamibacterales bacterium]